VRLAPGMRPDPDLTGAEWADQHRKLSSRAPAEPGQYRTARTPYRQIMDALSPRHPTQHSKNIETGMPKNEVATPL